MTTTNIARGLAPLQAALLHVLDADKTATTPLTVRQIAILVICYRTTERQTIRGLAATLGLSKSVVTRGLDHLESLALLKRIDDASDMRSVLVQPTEKGVRFATLLAKAVQGATVAA